MVSTPSWHDEFYIREISDVLSGLAQAEILISGAADYSTLAYAVHCANNVGIPTGYTVLDLCDTPLFMCRWYAKRNNVIINTLKSNIFNFQKNDFFDSIITDAFLTRFGKEKMSEVLKIWHGALKNGGYVVTTVRIHDENHVCPDTPSSTDIEQFKQKAYHRAKILGKHMNYSPCEIADMAEVYAARMRSNNLGSKENVMKSFEENGFHIEHIEDVEVAGELYPSRYLRIRARKKNCDE